MTSRRFRAFSQFSLLTTLFLLQFAITLRAQDLSNESIAAATAPVTFNFVAIPNILSVSSLAADSENDIWATSFISPVSLHFNGSTWRKIPQAKASQIAKLAVLSPTNVWAVGQQTTARFSQIQRFNGIAWTVVSSPHFAAGETLHSLKAVSANSIFAVGETLDTLNNRIPLIEHFNGTSWSVMPVPQITGGELFDIAIISAADIWAVGGTPSAALTMHFNGQQWSRVPAPNAALFGVAALSTTNVWAVGNTLLNGAVVEHWNGTSWKKVTSPNLGNVSALVSVSAILPIDIWAAGCFFCGDAGSGQPPLIEHWDGTAWTVNPAPTEFAGVTANAVLTFPSRHIFVGGVAQDLAGAASVIMKGVEGQ